MEQRLHITIIFPNDDTREAEAFDSVLDYLATNAFPGQGFSLLKQVEGYWRTPENEEWIRDYSTWFITDVPLPETPDGSTKISQLLLDVRSFALAAYRTVGKPQDEIWITSHPVARHGS